MRDNELRSERILDGAERWSSGVHADPVQREATEWLLRLQSVSATESDKAAFLAWMDQDVRHVSTFVEIFWMSYRTWTMPEDYRAKVRKLIEDRYTATEQVAKRPHGSSRRRVYAVAASVALCISAALLQFVLFKPRAVISIAVSTSEFGTSVGENRTIVLEDDSRLALGGHSRVEVALSSEKRTVTIHEGEAYFQVAKDRVRAFTVHAGTADVIAVGTAFNINRSTDSSTVTVIEGTVLVTPTAQRSRGAPMRGVRLNAGEQVIVTNLSVGSPLQVRDLASITSWQTGRLSFRQRPLHEAIGDVNRYAKKPLVLAPEVSEVAVTGTLTINNIGGWIKSLERAFELRATEQADRIIIRPAGTH